MCIVTQRIWQYRWWLALAVAIPIAGFAFFLWWMSAEYRPDLVTFTEVTIDGVPVETDTITLEAGKIYKFSCKATANDFPFEVVDSKGQPYVDNAFPMLPKPRPACPYDRFDPVFILTVSPPWPRYAGKSTAFTCVTTDDTGESAIVTQRFKAPLTTGKFELGVAWGTNPGGYTKMGPNQWQSRRMRRPTILWRTPIVVSANR